MLSDVITILNLTDIRLVISPPSSSKKCKGISLIPLRSILLRQKQRRKTDVFSIERYTVSAYVFSYKLDKCARVT